MTPLQAARLIQADYDGAIDPFRRIRGEGIDGSLYGSGSSLTLVAQGSVGITDWVRNLRPWPKEDDGVSGARWLDGMVGEADVLWDALQDYWPKWIIGHSRGGGVGQPLCVPFLKRDPEARAILFACPASLRSDSVPPWFKGLEDRVTIINMRMDPVCWMPPSGHWTWFGTVRWLPAVRPWFSHRINWYMNALEQKHG